MEAFSGVSLQWEGKGDKTKGKIPEYSIRTESIFPNPIFQSNNLFGEKPYLQSADTALLNNMFLGDNLEVMEYLLQLGYAEKIDLIYIDPPFLSKSNYNSRISVEKQGRKQFIARSAFTDRDEDLVSYLQRLYGRLQLMKTLLSEQGSIFVHLDWHSSHYVKILLDEIFGKDNFINEIIWCYGGGSGAKRHFHRKHDQILWYSRGKEYTFNPQYRPYTKGTLQRGLTRVKGEKYKLSPKGALLQDWWTDINKILSPTASENLKYPTQKPVALIKRIIAAASEPGDLVADFYAGSGTTAEACEEMDRLWISSDISQIALQSSRYRLLRRKARPFRVMEIYHKETVGNNQGVLELIVPVVSSYDQNQVMIRLGISPDNQDTARYLDYWELDLNYNGSFSSHLQVLREKPDYSLPLPLQLSILLPKQEKYCMAIKTYDVFGNASLRGFAF